MPGNVVPGFHSACPELVHPGLRQAPPLSPCAAWGYSSAMASLNPINAPPATPAAPADAAAARTARTQDRRLRLEDILKLMVAEGLVTAADADRLARSRTHRFEHPLEMIADQKWRSLLPPRALITPEGVVELLARHLRGSLHPIDPPKNDLVSVT